ncbi:hypothetical protein [Staphylococcus pasteuri]|uniref:hypothetical protein n=2 Tax=Bacillales TaxID=1385 RepID=UPI0012B95498|nr:hypothetical protein [Staphylococcus pasteuri]
MKLNLKRKSILLVAGAVLLSPVVESTPNIVNGEKVHQADAASKDGFKYYNTQYSSTAASDFATKSAGYAAAGALGYATGGAGAAVLSGVATGHLTENVGKIKTVYLKDKQYINKRGQVKHNVTMYKDKKHKKKIGTAKFMTSTTYPGGSKQ